MHSRLAKFNWLLKVALVSCNVVWCAASTSASASTFELGSGWQLELSGLSPTAQGSRCYKARGLQAPPHSLGVASQLRGGSTNSADDIRVVQGGHASSTPAATWLDGDGSLGSLGTASTSQLVLRACLLVLFFSFPVITAGLAYVSPWFREKVWYSALTRSIALCGTAFIKWGQWSSTRPDMFPEGLCNSLAVLHKGAPSHKYSYTKKLVERAYGGRAIGEVFDWFDKKPMASGSIAQVHKAVLQGNVVAVKVRHPKVKERMFMDFLLMQKLAAFADKTPSLKWMNLGPSMEQFSHTMTAQTDLLLEADNLDAFNANFAGKGWEDCVFPRVLHRVEDVLVETFEDGLVVSDYAKLFDNKKPLNGNAGMWEWGVTKLLGKTYSKPQVAEQADHRLGHFIVTRGEDMWLKMVLKDGFLHADLHPGNILVHAGEDAMSPPRLVLVDAGMVAKLFGHQRRHFIRLLECLGSGNGAEAGRAVLEFSTKQTCVGKLEQEAFLNEMDAVFRERCRGYHTDVDVGDILRGVLTCVRRHSVRVDVEYATLILNILCLDSIGKALVPTYNILDGAQVLLEAHKIGQRLVGDFGVKAILPLAQAVKSRQDRKFLRQLLRDTSSLEDNTGETATDRDYQHQDTENAIGRKTPEVVASKPLSGNDGGLVRASSARAAIAASSEMGGNLDAARLLPVDDRNAAAVGAVQGSGPETAAEIVICGDLPASARVAGGDVCGDLPASAGVAGEVVCGDLPTSAGVVVGKAADRDAEVVPVGVERQSGREISSIEELRQELRKAEHKDMPYGQGCGTASVRGSIENGLPVRSREDGAKTD